MVKKFSAEQIAAAKNTLTIPQIATRLGLPSLQIEPNRSPFREDKHPSFSVYDGGRRFKDHGNGHAESIRSLIEDIAHAQCNGLTSNESSKEVGGS